MPKTDFPLKKIYLVVGNSLVVAKIFFLKDACSKSEVFSLALNYSVVLAQSMVIGKALVANPQSTRVCASPVWMIFMKCCLFQLVTVNIMMHCWGQNGLDLGSKWDEVQMEAAIIDCKWYMFFLLILNVYLFLAKVGHIERVFNSASHKKVWDHFTKAQRKNIDLWKKQSTEIKVVQLDDSLLNNEEMDMSDNEEEAGPARKRGRREDSLTTDSLKEENDSLRCQLEAYKNEVDLVRSELRGELGMKEAQLKVLQQTLQGLQQKLLEGQHQRIEDEAKIKELTARLNSVSTTTANAEDKSGSIDLDPKPASDIVDSSDSKTTEEGVRITNKEARLIGLTSAFLHVHPFGAGVDYVWSYLQKLEPSLRPTEVEALMTRFPMVFRQELSGIGANMERRWQFAGFNNQKSTDSTA